MNKKILVLSIKILLPLPLVINFLFNRKNFQTLVMENFFQNIFLTLVLFLILLSIGSITKSLFKLKTISFGIVCFVSLLFLINNIFLYFLRNVDSFMYYLFFTLIFFLLSFFKSKNKVKEFTKIFTSIALSIFSNYLLNNFFNRFVLYSKNELFTSDETRFWTPVTRMIFDDNYFKALINNPIEGYGLFAAYTKSYFSFLLNFSAPFNYIPSISNVFILLFFLLIYESEFNFEVKLFTSICIFAVIFTSTWFNYLFFNSLLGEGPSGYFFGVIIYELTNLSKRRDITNRYLLIISILLGMLVYSKNFLTVTSLFTIFLIFQLIYKSVFLLLVGLLPLIVSFINNSILKTDVLWTFYLNTSNSESAGIYFNIENALKIIYEYLVDRPISYFTFLVIFFLLVNYKKLNGDNILKICLLSLIFNSLIIFLLGVFVAQSPEPEQLPRYLILLFYIYSLALMYGYDEFTNKKHHLL